MDCYRRVLRSWMQKVRYKEVKRRLGVEENSMQVIMKRKLGLFSHVKWMIVERSRVMFGILNDGDRTCTA
jgi:hypothetical protein